MLRLLVSGAALIFLLWLESETLRKIGDSSGLVRASFIGGSIVGVALMAPVAFIVWTSSRALLARRRPS